MLVTIMKQIYDSHALHAENYKHIRTAEMVNNSIT